jgi:hypothetical protein
MKMKGGNRVAHTGGREIHIAFWLGKLKEGDHLEDLGADGRIILKLIFQK